VMSSVSPAPPASPRPPPGSASSAERADGGHAPADDGGPADEPIDPIDPIGPIEPTPVVFIMGAGVVGRALAARLVRAGVPVAGLHGRQAELSDAASAISGALSSSGEIPEIVSESDVIIISVRDERIKEVAERLVREKRLRKNQIVLHTSGANAAADILAVARPQVRGLGTLHPLVSFADPRLAVVGLKTVAFGLEGDVVARRAAARLVSMMGARSVVLESRNLALYHAGAVLVSNYVVVLADLARSLLVEAGVPADEALPALIPLLTSVVQNLAQMGLPAALTGPVERGDVSSVARHLQTLTERAPGVVELYRLMGREVLRIALSKGPLDADAVGRLEELFGSPAAPGASPAPPTSTPSGA
jgi:predicted short-subunit dehydrogenase-like oxidoreductase (DUF2520 family)